MSKLLEKIKKNSTIKESDAMCDTLFFEGKEVIQTAVPALNIALSGSITGGFKGGIGIIAGPSRHFKSSIMLMLVVAFQKKYPDGIVLFYDSEFGSPPAYFSSFDIDLSRVFHTPIVNIEQLKTDIVTQLKNFDRNDKVMIVIDSFGNLASSKEINDALDEKNVADFSRAKAFKSLGRMITPQLAMKDIPLIAIAHTYETMEMYSKQVISGGTGLIYSSDWAIIVGRQQEKDGTDLIGYNFILNIEKSRLVREKTKIPLNVTFEGGISKWSGLLDLALESGHVIKPSNGWYSRVNKETGEVEENKWRAKETDCSEFWGPIITSKSFNSWIEERYKIANVNMLTEEELATTVDQEYANVE